MNTTEYRFQSLDEIEEFVKANKHLPRIPRTSLGMFDRADICLEKIEELFLHCIELHKRIKVLENDRN